MGADAKHRRQRNLALCVPSREQGRALASHYLTSDSLERSVPRPFQKWQKEQVTAS